MNNSLSKNLIAFVLILFLGKTEIFAQTASISIHGEVTTPLTLSLDDLDKFEKQTQKIKDRDGKEHTFEGPALAELLKKAGVTLGSSLRGENLTKFVLVQAADGYEIVYSLAEVDPEFSKETIILATKKDGAAIPAGEGPFRMIAPADKKPARWIREVRTIKVLFPKQ